ncbi:hypothetical protein [Halorubrum californiense]|uniref:hypothetical protein n=1 Tax=Halorubrum californiense TaxID=416585 RepID=UPI0012678482|nr:hypothetical protein [Halorubrum californiense]
MVFGFSQLQALSVFTTLLIGGWWTFTLRTRTTHEKVRREMRTQFWINHSVDLPYAPGQLSPEATDSRLVVKGIEINENYWWLRIGDRTDPYILADPKETYQRVKRRIKAFAAKGQYLLYRNFVPYAGIKTEVELLIQTERCRIRMNETVEETDIGTLYEGPRVGEAVPVVGSVNELWDDLYRVHVETDDYVEADKAMRELASSDFIELRRNNS